MKIIYGINSFLLKKIRLTYFGKLEDDKHDLTIEIRQFYFHLFFIPFFGIGKNNFLRKEGELCSLPEEYEMQVQDIRKNVKTPWYTFAGLILLFVIYIGYLGLEGYEKYCSYRFELSQIDTKIDMINHPLINDFYTLSAEDYKYYVVQVSNSTLDSVEFKIAVQTKLNDKMDEICREQYYQDSTNLVCRRWISKKTLLNCCLKKHEDSNSFKGDYIDELFFMTEKKIVISSIYR